MFKLIKEISESVDTIDQLLEQLDLNEEVDFSDEWLLEMSIDFESPGFSDDQKKDMKQSARDSNKTIRREQGDTAGAGSWVIGNGKLFKIKRDMINTISGNIENTKINVKDLKSITISSIISRTTNKATRKILAKLAQKLGGNDAKIFVSPKFITQLRNKAQEKQKVM